MARMEGLATDGIDGRFAQDHDGKRFVRDGEAAQVSLGAEGQAVPGTGGGPAQFGADRDASLVAQEEDGVGSGVGVERARRQERFQEGGGQAPRAHQVLADTRELVRVRGRKPQRDSGRRRHALRRQHAGKVIRQPSDRRFEVQVV